MKSRKKGFTPLDLGGKQRELKKGLTGFTLIELVMAIIIASIILIPTSVVVVESLRNTFLPEHFTIASSLLLGKLEEVTNLRYNDKFWTDIANQGSISFINGEFSDYFYEVTFYYVQASDLNTKYSDTEDTGYKRVEITISRSGFPDIIATTIITNS